MIEVKAPKRKAIVVYQWPSSTVKKMTTANRRTKIDVKRYSYLRKVPAPS
jgi:hypothetical protein